MNEYSRIFMAQSGEKVFGSEHLTGKPLIGKGRSKSRKRMTEGFHKEIRSS